MLKQIHYKQIIAHSALFAIACAFILIYSTGASPLYLNQGVDSQIFNVMGLGITQGKLPYVHLFDHKGPLLFYIFALAKLIIASKMGIYIISVIFMYCSLLLQYKISLMYVNEKKVWLSLVIPLAFLAICMAEGTQCEFFELPFIYLSLYCCLKLFKCSCVKHPRWLCFWMGVAFGCILMIRINDACILTGMMFLMFIIYTIKRNELKQAMIDIAFFVLGAVASLLPFIIYFIYKGMLYDVWFANFIFNIKYESGAYLVYGFPFLKLLILSLFIICALSLYKKPKSPIELTYIILPVLIVSIFGIGNNPFVHYYIVLVPIIGLITLVCDNSLLKSFLLWVFVVSGWNIATDKVPLWPSLIYTTYHHYLDFRNKTVLNKRYAAMRDMINDNVPEKDRDKIWSYNLTLFDVYLVNSITPANRFFVPHHKFASPDIYKQCDIKEVKPDWMLIYTNTAYMAPTKEDEAFIRSHYIAIDSLLIDDVVMKLLKRDTN